MELIKIDIGSKMNLTLLAKAYVEGLFPLSTYGELYYDQNLSNVDFPVRYLFFKEDYYNHLISFISNEEVAQKMRISNSSNEWYDLVNVLRNNKIKVSADIGILHIYTPGKSIEKLVLDEEKTKAILNREKICSSNIKEIQKEIVGDLKRIYEGLYIDVLGVLIKISLPIENGKAQYFSLSPFLKLLEKYEQKIKNVEIRKESWFDRDITIFLTVKDW